MMKIPPCFYCGRQMSTRRISMWARPPRDARTGDHIVPQTRVRDGGYPETIEWKALNIVQVCWQCNAQKADMWPLDWIEVMPDFGVKRLLRLLRLGCPGAEIDAAVARRR